jgi:hypothetical protein
LGVDIGTLGVGQVDGSGLGIRFIAMTIGRRSGGSGEVGLPDLAEVVEEGRYVRIL